MISDTIRDVWIYRLKAEKIVETPAFIFANGIPGITTISAYDRDNKNYLCQVPNGEGYLFNNTLWLSKHDFDKAKDIFLFNLEAKISECYSEAEDLNHIAGCVYKQRKQKEE